jgi:heptosyltransferase I
MNKKKLLLIRLDKIGDLICTLGVDQIPEVQKYDRLWVINKGLSFVTDHLKHSSEHTPARYLELEKSQPRIAFKKLLDLLKKEKPDVAISFQATWWVNFALFLSGVPIRAGVLSQWHSFLFLNKGLRQKRSLAVQHESEYNQELLCYALDLPSSPVPIVELKIQDPQNEIEKFLSSKNIEPLNYVVVHPGMAGSALNWPVQKYADYIIKLSHKYKVVLTGTAMDDPWIHPLLEILMASPEYSKLNIINLQSQITLKELLWILKNAKWVLAPSTGVTHLTAALGTPLKSIYSPIRVHLAKRWGPRGLGKIEILSPQVPCPEAFVCAGSNCPFYNCMDGVNILNDPNV